MHATFWDCGCKNDNNNSYSKNKQEGVAVEDKNAFPYEGTL